MSLINPMQMASRAPLPNLTEASWLALGMSNQLGYIARDAVRVQAVPDHRKADTLARNFVPAFMIPLIMESAFRMVDTYYVMPLMSEALKLKELGYKTMPEELRGRMVSRLVMPSSVFVVPRVLKNTELQKPMDAAKRSELEKLTTHMQKMLCPTDYLDELVQKKELSAPDARQVKKISADILKKLNVEDLFHKGITAYDEPAMQKTLARVGKQHWESHLNKEELLKHTRMCIDSKFTQEMVKRIQKTATWQNMFMATLMSFVFYGLMANLLEVKVVRPWQKRLVAERGTAKEVVAPCYIATVPWLLSVFIGLSNKAPQFLQKMTHLNRFLAVSGIAFSSFFATAGLLIKWKLSTPPSKEALQAARQKAVLEQQQASSVPAGNSTFSHNAAPNTAFATGGFGHYAAPQAFAQTSPSNPDRLQTSGATKPQLAVQSGYQPIPPISQVTLPPQSFSPFQQQGVFSSSKNSSPPPEAMKRFA